MYRLNLVVNELQIKGVDTNALSGFVPMMVTILFDHILDWEPAGLKNRLVTAQVIDSVSMSGSIRDLCNLREGYDVGFPVTCNLYSS